MRFARFLLSLNRHRVSSWAFFINSSKPAEHLRLNADGSFSLTEAGRSYTGRFAAGEGRLVLRVSETGRSVVATVQDDKLIDGGGQIWVPEDSR